MLTGNQHRTITLHQAAGKGDINSVKTLLAQEDVNVNAEDENGKTPLRLAIEHRQIKIIWALLGKDINTQDKDGYTLLHRAARHDSLDIAKLLIKNRADINAKNIDGRIPLHVAAIHGNLNVAKLLIKACLLDNSAMEKPEYLNSNPELSENWDICTETVRMKKTKIGDSTISFYQFLTERDENKLAGYLNNEEIRKALKIGSHKNDSFHDSDFTKDQNSGLVKGEIGKGLETINYESDFPHYSDRIKNQIKKATQRRIASFNIDQKIKISTIDNKETLAPYLIDEVIKYLSNEDLDNLKEAGKAKNVCTATEGAEQKFAEIVKKVRIDQDTNISSGLEDIDVSQASAGIDK